MKIIYITCVLLAITIGSFADTGVVKQADKSANQQSTVEQPSVLPPHNAINKNESVTTAIPGTQTVPDSPKTTNVTEPPPTITTAHTTVVPKTNTTTTNATTSQTTAIPTVQTTVPTTPTKPTIKPTVAPDTTTVLPNSTEAHVTTTAHPGTSMASPSSPSTPSGERHFDGLSFLGGIILTVCLMGLGVFARKFYKNCNERQYGTL